MHPRVRLRRAVEARRRSIEEYGDALRAGLPVDDLAARCRETDAELTEATTPFMEGRAS
jgi:hypothetical protein